LLAQVRDDAASLGMVVAETEARRLLGTLP
jgi:hypothetical protein